MPAANGPRVEQRQFFREADEHPRKTHLAASGVMYPCWESYCFHDELGLEGDHFFC